MPVKHPPPDVLRRLRFYHLHLLLLGEAKVSDFDGLPVPTEKDVSRL
jgi:hypothetical protein